jgi:hypothetical protein
VAEELMPDVAAPESEPVNPVAERRLKVVPYPGRRPDLATLSDVRREMGRVYREMRFKKIDTQDGTRLSFVLMQIGKLIQTTELEARVEAMERALGQRRKS